MSVLRADCRTDRVADPAETTVAVFLPNLGVGGAQRVAIAIVNGLADRGYDVHLVLPFTARTHTTAHEDGDRLVREVSEAVRLFELDAPRVPALGVLAAIPALRRYLASAAPDVLFAHQTHTNIAAVLAARLAGGDTHVAVTEHTAYDFASNSRDRVAKVLARYVYRRADDVVAVSEGVAESLVAARFDRSDLTVLYNPIDTEAIRRGAARPVDHEWFDDEELRPILSVGRLEPPKDVPTLLRAFARVHAARPETRLLVAGDGSEYDRLVDLADSLGVADVVDFLGYVDPYPFMGRADAFVLSSRQEGLPTVLVEALACGCPVVATDCPYGPREILDGDTYGALVPVGHERAMAAAIERTLDAPVDRETCLERAEAFSAPVGIDRYEAYVAAAVA